jgi:NADH-quinone oxidoreductase subunit L
MTIILNLTWAVVLFPLLGVGAAFLAESPRRAAQTTVAFTGFALAIAVVVLLFRLTHVIPVYENTQTFWDLQSSGSRNLPGEFLVLWGIRIDPLSVALMAAVLFLSLLAQVHALGSLRGDPAFRRFFWISGVLTFGLLALISSPNLFQFWLGWEVAGVAAWMLAAHVWQRPAVAAAATRTFVLLRVADLILLLGLVMTFAKFGIAVSQQPAPTGQVSTDPLSFSVLGPVWHLGHTGLVAGVGARTLVVLGVLFVVAAAIRAGLGPLHVWLSNTLDAPVAGLALVVLGALVPAAVLIARVYPLLLEAPHLLTALALIGAVGAVAAAVLALAQRDLFRLGIFAVCSQAGLIMATFGMGGYSPALFMLFTACFLAVTYFLAAGNLSRGYRTRQVGDCGGAWRLMRRTALALGGWAAGISGLSLNTYSVLSATLRNTQPTGGRAGSLTEVVVVAAALIAIALTAVYSFRLFFLVATGDPIRRRGFDASRLREADPRLRGTALLALAGAAAATLVGIPGVSAFSIGTSRVPGLTFSHFIFYGGARQQLALDFLALALAAVITVGGAGAAWWLFSPGRRDAAAALRARFARLYTPLADPTPSERLAAIAPVAFIRAGETLQRFDEQLIDPVPTAMGQSVVIWSDLLAQLRSTRIGLSTAAAFAVIAVLVAASILAATGHFPVHIQ